MEQEPNQKGAALEVYDKFEETAATLSERAVQLKTQLADKLATGASTIRQRSSDTAKIDDAIATTKEKVADAGDRVASGMERRSMTDFLAMIAKRTCRRSSRGSRGR